MQDIRQSSLLGLGNSDSIPGPGGSNEVRQNPAQAFDAVMSRYATRDAAGPARETRTAPRPADDSPSQASGGAKDGKPASADDAAKGDTSANPKGQPVARTGADAGDEDAQDPAAGSGDVTALFAAVASAAQLAANPGAVAEETPAEDATPARPLAMALDKRAGAAALGLASEPHSEAQSAALAEARPGVEQVEAAPVRRTLPSARETTARVDATALHAREDVGAAAVQSTLAKFEAVVGSPAHGSAGTTPHVAIAQPVAAAVSLGIPATYSVAHATIASPVGTAAFTADLAQHLVVFAGQKVQRAEIALSPAELGPLAVSIEVRGQEAMLAFSAAHGATRAALEDALPRLRDMLAAQGLQLAGAHVGAESGRDQYRPGRGGFGSGRGDTPAVAAAAADAAAASVHQRALGLIDVVV